MRPAGAPVHRLGAGNARFIAKQVLFIDTACKAVPWGE
jgi:hypothetical protein